MLTRADLLKEFQSETGDNAVMPDGSINILYVQWLEGRLLLLDGCKPIPDDIYRVVRPLGWVVSCESCGYNKPSDTECSYCGIKPMD